MAEHNHIFHILPALLIVLGLIITFTRQIPRVSIFSLTVFIVLISFTLIHINPAKLLLAHYHEEVSHGTHHPCCMPSGGNGLIMIFFEFAVFVISLYVFMKILQKPPLFSPQPTTRSPPK